MSGWRFHTPGWVDKDELPTEFHDAWHDHQASLAREFIDDMRSMSPPNTDRDAIPYVNPIEATVPEARTPTPVPWDGFPEAVSTRFSGDEAYTEVEHLGHEDFFGFGIDDAQVVEVIIRDEQEELVPSDLDCRVRDRQDEYLEWHATTVDGVLKSVTFVCEGYDYYEFMFRTPKGRDRVVELYRTATGNPSITAKDLMASEHLALVQPDGSGELFARKGGFNPRNRFNRETGIVHLSHKANSLGAEVRLAVTSALPRVDADGTVVDAGDEKRLMCCTRGGEPSRSSDPLIAAGAYGMVTDPARPQRFTLTDPIGLYIRTFRHRSLQFPDGREAPRTFWDVQRGKDATNPDDPWDSRILRLHLEVPEDRGILGEMLVDGNPIEHPAQLAELIKMHLLVDAWDAPPGVIVPSLACKGGCCRDLQTGLLELWGRSGPRCGPDAKDAYPGLVDTVSPPKPPSPLIPTTPAPMSRRHL